MVKAAATNDYKHSEQEYIDADIFFGEEGELTCRVVKLRKAKKEHQCFSLYGDLGHSIKPGELYRHERAGGDGTQAGGGGGRVQNVSALPGPVHRWQILTDILDLHDWRVTSTRQEDDELVIEASAQETNP